MSKTARLRHGKKRGRYVPPIAWDRLNAMFVALYKHMRKGEPIGIEMASEIYDALRRLHAIYQEQLKRTLPPRRTKAEDLQNAYLAQMLAESLNVPIHEALAAVTKIRVGRDSANATHRNRVRETLERTDDWMSAEMWVRFEHARCCLKITRSLETLNDSVVNNSQLSDNQSRFVIIGDRDAAAAGKTSGN